MGSMMQDLAFAIPGVDEAMGFAEIMKQVSRPPLRFLYFSYDSNQSFPPFLGT